MPPTLSDRPRKRGPELCPNLQLWLCIVCYRNLLRLERNVKDAALHCEIERSEILDSIVNPSQYPHRIEFMTVLPNREGEDLLKVSL
jgi:hypothetical protein